MWPAGREDQPLMKGNESKQLAWPGHIESCHPQASTAPVLLLSKLLGSAFAVQ
jgi:hypothetical protein